MRQNGKLIKHDEEAVEYSVLKISDVGEILLHLSVGFCYTYIHTYTSESLRFTEHLGKTISNVHGFSQILSIFASFFTLYV